MRTGTPVPSEIGGYILAGGKSSRMGQDKALLELAGKPLIRHAVEKLRRVCVDVRILSQNPALGDFAPIVPDLHPDCGPIGGIEAALAHSVFEWNLILPVDVPLLPTHFLSRWVQTVTHHRTMSIRIAMFSVSGIPQPTLLLIHRDAAHFLTLAIARKEYKLLPALETAARELAPPGARPYEQIPYMLPVDENFKLEGWNIPTSHLEPWETLTPSQKKARSLWFANLNTPEDFAEAETHIDALDT